jgi:hypothetical protein
METNETMEPLGGQPPLNLNQEAQAYLKEAGKWAYFLGIIGFIGCALLLIFSFFAGFAGSFLSTASEASPNPLATAMAAMGAGITVVYILVDLWYFFFSLYLYQFGVKIKRGVVFYDNITITAAFSKLKSFFKLWGISTIVILVLYALGIIAAIIFVFSMGRH